MTVLHVDHPKWHGLRGIRVAQRLDLRRARHPPTVAVALALGLAPLAAAEFSFLLGIIAIAGAAVLALPDLAAAAYEQRVHLFYGGLAALLAGLAAIWAFVRMLEGGYFYLFAGYVWVVGGLFLLWALGSG
ncbi:MAG: hypothetical protein CMJ59_24860 [Planctomycetaceae bacterium]|nr:hypothetical protein [Planctomycetaceae bacterium]